MYFQLESTPPSLRLANTLRIFQFFVKLMLCWWVFIDTLFNSNVSSLALIQVIFASPFFLWYQFWRMGYLIKRVKMYILQWSFCVFDIAAFSIVKCLYFYDLAQTLNSDGFSTFFSALTFIYMVYLLFPIIIFTTWMITFCKMRQATKEMEEMSGLGGVASDLVSHLPNHVTIQSIALQNKCIRFMVYVNIVYAFGIALTITVGSLMFYSEQNLSTSNVPFILIIVELLDLVLNIIEDRVVCHFANQPVARYFIETPLPVFGACCCRSYNSVDVSGASLPMLD